MQLLRENSEVTCLLTISEMKDLSNGNNKLLYDAEICAEEIKKILKLGKSGGPDGFTPEHIVYGGEVLKIWL